MNISKINQCNKDIYAKLALSYIPHLLGLVDRNKLSPTYGCFDREYWHYKTSDFPCGMNQEFVLPLAILYNTNFEKNRWFHQKRIKELVIAGIDFSIKNSHSDGSCDDYYPWERAIGALAFSTYAFTESYILLNLSNQDFIDFFSLRGDFLINHNESGKLSNHQALSALVLYNIYLITKNKKYKEAANERLSLTLSWQDSKEGWFQEYEGADPGYHTCTIDFLAKYYKKSNDEKLLDPLKTAVDFTSYFIHPDGSYGGEYGSRNTYHFYPHGFEILSKEIPLAGQIADSWIQGAYNEKRYFNDDDRMVGHLAYNFLQSYIDYSPRDNHGISRAVPFKKWFPSAGLGIVSKQNYYAVFSLKKGGIIKVFNNKECLLSDTGLIGRNLKNQILVSHMYDNQNKILFNQDNEFSSVEGLFCIRSCKLSSPFKLIIFRLLNVTFGRFFPNALRSILQKILITGKNRTFYSFYREIHFFENKIQIKDRFNPKIFKDLYASSDATSIYVAASNVYQDSVMHEWKYFSNEDLNNKGEWIRELQIDNTNES